MAKREKGSFFGFLRRKSKKRKKAEVVDWDLPLWDMHCHILPEVDDGSESLEDSLKMIQMEMEEGVTDIMLTPHYIRGKTDLKLIQVQYQKLQEEVKKRNYPVQLYLGNELFYHSDILEELQSGEALTLAGTAYVLIEFPIGISYQRMKMAFQELLMSGYRPILAHLERFECLLDDKERIFELIDLGVLMQANTNSFLRNETRRFLLQLLEYEGVHFVGTDSHRPDWRPPKMREAMEVIYGRLDREEMIQLFVENPKHLQRNEYL